MTSLEQLQMVALGLETKPSLESRGNKKLCTLQAADVIVQMKPVIRSFGSSRKVAVWFFTFFQHGLRRTSRKYADHIVPTAILDPFIGRFFSTPCSLTRPIRSPLYDPFLASCNVIVLELAFPLIHIYDIMIHHSLALDKEALMVDKFLWKYFSFSFSDQFTFWPVRSILTYHVTEKDPFISFNFVSNNFITIAHLWLVMYHSIALLKFA